jgi:hypothetical protein
MPRCNRSVAWESGVCPAVRFACSACSTCILAATRGIFWPQSRLCDGTSRPKEEGAPAKPIFCSCTSPPRPRNQQTLMAPCPKQVKLAVLLRSSCAFCLRLPCERVICSPPSSPNGPDRADSGATLLDSHSTISEVGEPLMNPAACKLGPGLPPRSGKPGFRRWHVYFRIWLMLTGCALILLIFDFTCVYFSTPSRRSGLSSRGLDHFPSRP